MAAERNKVARCSELGKNLVAQLPFFTDLSLQNNQGIILALGRCAFFRLQPARPQHTSQRK